ncbi:MAG: SurA N-terminal domain-containing protein [Nitrospirota bacterium]
MLKLMRKHAKYFYILFFMVIISFVFWGIGTVDKRGNSEIVAEVGKYKITVEEYWRTYDRVSRFYREIYKDKFDEEMENKMKLKEKVLDSMIDERVLLIVAKDAGISVSDDEVQEAIAKDSAFMREGVFDRNVYINRLRLNRMTPEIYERLKRQELTLNKIRRLIELSVDITGGDLNLKQVSNDEQVTKMLNETILNAKREKAVKSYIEGLKKQMKIKINSQLIS